MRRAGFTLSETVVAMALFAAAATTLCQAALNAREGLARLNRRDAPHVRINWVRDDLLAITDRETLEEGGEMEFPLHVRKKGSEDGEPEEEDGDPVRVRWEAEIAPTPLLDVHQLTIKLTFERGEQMLEPQEAAYYVYRPGWYEDDGRKDMMTEKRDEWERRQLSRGI